MKVKNKDIAIKLYLTVIIRISQNEIEEGIVWLEDKQQQSSELVKNENGEEKKMLG